MVEVVCLGGRDWEGRAVKRSAGATPGPQPWSMVRGPKDFGPYLKSNGEPLKSFKQKGGVVEVVGR